MTTDPEPYIYAAAILGSIIGFFGCALYASQIIRRVERESYRDGYEACNRDSNQPRI